MLMADPPDRFDCINAARALLIVAVGLTLAPAVLMTADHLLRQRPGAERQAAVFAAIGLSDLSFFPSGHPARSVSGITGGIDWRPTPALPPASPGPVDLVRPTAASRKRPTSER
jgi:hypothetical protein